MCAYLLSPCSRRQSVEGGGAEAGFRRAELGKMGDICNRVKIKINLKNNTEPLSHSEGEIKVRRRESDGPTPICRGLLGLVQKRVLPGNLTSTPLSATRGVSAGERSLDPNEPRRTRRFSVVLKQEKRGSTSWTQLGASKILLLSTKRPLNIVGGKIPLLFAPPTSPPRRL